MFGYIKRRLKIYLFFLILFIPIFSCKKKLSFQILGQIYDASFHKELADAKIVILKINDDGTYEDTPIFEGYSDINGKFSKTINREKALKYIIKISKENYFEIENEINFSDLSTEKPKIMLFQIFAKSWINFKLNNVSTANNSDVLTLSFNDKNPSCFECCTKNKFYFNGNIHENLICTFYGNIEYKFNYISSNPFEQKDFSVKTIAMDTVEYEINY